MKNEKLREVPVKNYIILGVVIIATMALVYFIFSWYDSYKERKLNVRILDSYLEIINYNELDNYLIENPNAVIYMSVLEDVEIREFEKKFKRLLKNRNLSWQILYMDVTNEKNVKKNIKNKYGINDVEIPMILVFNDGMVSDIYRVKSNGYDIDNFREFIDNIENNREDDING